MDKVLVNEQITSMRCLVKKAKRAAIQKYNHLMKDCEASVAKAKERNDDKSVKIYNQKYNSYKRSWDLLHEIHVNPDDVSKLALVKEDLHNYNPTSNEEKVCAIIGRQKPLQDAVKKFRQENPSCDIWIGQLIELWKEKKEIRSGDYGLNTRKEDVDIKSKMKEKKIPEMNNYEKLNIVTPKEGMLVAKIDLNKLDKNSTEISTHSLKPVKLKKKAKEKTVIDREECRDGIEDGESESNSKVMDDDEDEEVDDFFVGDKIKQKVSKAKVPEQNPSHVRGSNREPVSQFKTFEAPRNKEYNTNQFKPMHGTTSHTPQNMPSSMEVDPKSLHPSWQAKQKQKMLIANSLTSTSSKRIKFDE